MRRAGLDEGRARGAGFRDLGDFAISLPRSRDRSGRSSSAIDRSRAHIAPGHAGDCSAAPRASRCRRGPAIAGSCGGFSITGRPASDPSGIEGHAHVEHVVFACRVGRRQIPAILIRIPKPFVRARSPGSPTCAPRDDWRGPAAVAAFGSASAVLVWPISLAIALGSKAGALRRGFSCGLVARERLGDLVGLELVGLGLLDLGARRGAPAGAGSPPASPVAGASAGSARPRPEASAARPALRRRRLRRRRFGLGRFWRRRRRLWRLRRRGRLRRRRGLRDRRARVQAWAAPAQAFGRRGPAWRSSRPP